MRTLVLGGTGMLGRAVVAAARRRSWPALGLSREQGDVRDGERLDYWMAAFRPELVINCAAFTKVDACETERERAFAVNGEAVGRVLRAAERAAARLLQVSTDYVFDGAAREPYREEAPAAPPSVYGQSKLLGERQALAAGDSLVVRTSWVFGPGGPNFVATIVGLLERGERPLRVVDDQVGGPTYAPFLAAALLDLARAGGRGIVHYRNREPVSWYAFATVIARRWRAHRDGAERALRERGAGARKGEDAGSAEVVPVATAEFPRPAPRPAYSVLDVARCERLLGRQVEPWEAGLVEYLPWLR